MTLMEMLVVIGVLGVLIGAAVGLFTRSLRGVGKTSAIIETEDSAQLALALIDRLVKNSRQILNVGGVACPTSGETMAMVMADGGTLVLSLVDGKIASNGASLTSDRTAITNLVFECVNQEDVTTRVTVSFDAGFAETETDIVSVKHYDQEITLRNL